MRLKWSTSSSSSAGGRLPVAARASDAASSSFRWRRLNTPVSASVRARWSASRRASSSASASRRAAPTVALSTRSSAILPVTSAAMPCTTMPPSALAGQARNDTQRVAPSRPMMRTESSVDSPFESRTRCRSYAGRSSGCTARVQAVTRSAPAGSEPPRIRSPFGPPKVVWMLPSAAMAYAYTWSPIAVSSASTGSARRRGAVATAAPKSRTTTTR